MLLIQQKWIWGFLESLKNYTETQLYFLFIRNFHSSGFFIYQDRDALKMSLKLNFGKLFIYHNRNLAAKKTFVTITITTGFQVWIWYTYFGPNYNNTTLKKFFSLNFDVVELNINILYDDRLIVHESGVITIL